MANSDTKRQVLEAGHDIMSLLNRVCFSAEDHAILDRALEFLFLKAAGEDVTYDPND